MTLATKTQHGNLRASTFSSNEAALPPCRTPMRRSTFQISVLMGQMPQQSFVC
ncbi:hypothetical protein ATI53_104725 [Salipiger aestuarii]|uniref:Uncharacterized protein n=1 Tax=Salipiger aestuarii TaxID=568098 RepID=A0A327XZU5_9RHOB|nr:hypothetical protein ATI53_104725 [Salipiger aestuarii]